MDSLNEFLNQNILLNCEFLRSCVIPMEQKSHLTNRTSEEGLKSESKENKPLASQLTHVHQTFHRNSSSKKYKCYTCSTNVSHGTLSNLKKIEQDF